MRFYDVAGNGPPRYCPPRNVMPCYSRKKGSECVWKRAQAVVVATSAGPCREGCRDVEDQAEL
jgi:hypothetical protein